jgi:hypothetical protein
MLGHASAAATLDVHSDLFDVTWTPLRLPSIKRR